MRQKKLIIFEHSLLFNILNEINYDFVFYVAGVDIHFEDRLGKLKITDEGINKRDQIVIENIDIPQNQQIDNTPPPARPSIPVPTDDEDIADDVTLDDLDFDDFEAWDAPPAPSGPKVKFIPYDDPPKPISAIRPVYPEIAQEAGIEGVVVVQAFIDQKGRVKETIILKGIPNTGLDEAAMEAIRKTRFRPAKQRERAVGVWISIPVNFRLK